MTRALPSVLLGYHGCDSSLADELLLGRESLRPSDNSWDWLAGGAYFWEQDAQRAYDFACEIRDKPHPHKKHAVVTPAVVGTVIEPGRCLNLLDSRCHPQLVAAHEALQAALRKAEQPMPINRGGSDKVLRSLDCAVLQTLHEDHERQSPGQAFQTVRAAFFEGEPLYPGGGFADKSHVQIAVRDPACILGYFRPRGADGEPLVFEPSSPAMPADADADAEAHP